MQLNTALESHANMCLVFSGVQVLPGGPRMPGCAGGRAVNGHVSDRCDHALL